MTRAKYDSWTSTLGFSWKSRPSTRLIGQRLLLLLAATLASAAVGNGHVCYPLEETPEQATLAELVQERCPDLEQWRKDLLATTVVGLPGETSP